MAENRNSPRPDPRSPSHSEAPPADDNVGAAPPADLETRPYEVGYGRPPKHSQFKPGQSGNRKGKSKGSRSFKTDLLEVLRTPVAVTAEGKPKKVSTQMGGMLRLREKALKGDVRALDRLLAYAAQYNVEEAAQASTAALLAEDRQILKNARERSGETHPEPPVEDGEGGL